MNESAPNDEGRTKRKALSAHRAATRRQKSERQFARTRDNRIRARNGSTCGSEGLRATTGQSGRIRAVRFTLDTGSAPG